MNRAPARNAGNHWRVLPYFLLAMLFTPNAGSAASGMEDDCRAYLAQHHYYAAPLTTIGVNEQCVEVKINGKTVRLGVDTGCGRTVLTDACARHLRLDVHDSGHADWGVGGTLRGNSGIALVQSFTLGGHEINRTNTILVMPKSAYDPGGDVDGLLGLDFLQLNAAILPIGAGEIILKPGTTPVAAMADFMAPLGFKAVPLGPGGGTLMITGHLNGTPFRAFLDSGATFTTFRNGFVQTALGHEAVQTNDHEFHGVDGHSMQTFRFTANALEVGGFHLPPTTILAAEKGFLEARGLDALIGFDLLGLHRAVIDLGSGVLWMK